VGTSFTKTTVTSKLTLSTSTGKLIVPEISGFSELSVCVIPTIGAAHAVAVSVRSSFGTITSVVSYPVGASTRIKNPLKSIIVPSIAISKSTLLGKTSV
jgi:hypothetical protein